MSTDSDKAMTVTTVRLPEALVDALDDEYGEYGFANRTEYIRWILRHRDAIPENAENTENAGRGRGGLAERVDALEDRLGDVEEDVGAIRTELATGDGGRSFKSGRSQAESGALSEGGANRMEPLADPGSAGGVAGGEPDGADSAEAWPTIDELSALHYREEPADDKEAAARDALDELKVKGRGEATRKVRREAVIWAWNYLRKHDTRRSSQIANATFGAYWGRDRLGYSTSTSGPYAAYGLWDSYLRDALKELPHVEAPPERGSTWRFSEQPDPDRDESTAGAVYDPTDEF